MIEYFKFLLIYIHQIRNRLNMQYEDKDIMKSFLKELYNVWYGVIQRFMNMEKLEYN